MEPVRSLQHLRAPVTCLYPEPHQSNSSPPSHFLNIRYYYILPSTPGFFKWSLSLRFPHHNPVFTCPLPHSATCPAHLILLNFINRIIFDEEYRSQGSSASRLLQSRVISFLLGPNIFLNITFSNTLGLIPPSMWKTEFDTHTKQQAEL